MRMAELIRGRLTVEADAGNFERFVNICRAKGIVLYNVSESDSRITFNMAVRDFRRIKPIVRKTGCRIKIRHKQGLPFVWLTYRKHYCFLIGVFLAMGIMYGLSLFLWRIEFQGNQTFTDNMLMKYLRELNVDNGMRVADVDCDYIEKCIRQEFNDITWVSASLEGTRLVVSVKENDGYVSKGKRTENGDIVAAANGIVKSIITRSGTALVKAGDTVVRGDVLIKGNVSLYNDAKELVGAYPVSADGLVVLETAIPYKEELPKIKEEKIYTGRKTTGKVLYFFGNFLKLGVGNSYELSDTYSSHEYFKLNDNFYLPFGVGEEVTCEYYCENREIDYQEAEKILKENLQKYLEKLEKKGVQIISPSVKIEETGEGYVMYGDIIAVYDAYEFIPFQ